MALASGTSSQLGLQLGERMYLLADVAELDLHRLILKMWRHRHWPSDCLYWLLLGLSSSFLFFRCWVVNGRRWLWSRVELRGLIRDNCIKVRQNSRLEVRILQHLEEFFCVWF